MPTDDNPVVALAVADLHLCHKPPVARSAEPDWYAAMERSFKQLRILRETLNEHHPLPILVAGDLMDKWNPPPELINFALATLPPLYAVPGNHDLPNHQYSELRRSAFFTLVKAKLVTLLAPGKPVLLAENAHPLRLHGFPVGAELKPLAPVATDALCLNIAVAHHYVWASEQTGYEGAAESDRVSAVRGKLKGFDLVVTGDNHIPFTARNRKPTIVNCGGFFRRRSDEIDHRPSVVVIRADGGVERQYLDGSADKFLNPEELAAKIAEAGHFEEFVEELGALADAGIDYREAVVRAMKEIGVSKGVRRELLGAMEEKS